MLLDRGFDATGTYRHALVSIGLCLMASAALLLVVPGRRHDANAPASP